MKLPILGAISLLAPLLLTAAEPVTLQIRIAESGGAVYLAGSRTSAVLTVEVIDPAGLPVEGAAVSVRLPATGPGGLFANGLPTDVVITDARGRASFSGVRWNQNPGSLELRVTAAKGSARASAVLPQRLLAPLDPSGPSLAGGGKGHGRLKYTLIVAGLAVGSAVAGLAVARRTSSPGEPVTTQSLSVGLPTSLTIGGP